MVNMKVEMKIGFSDAVSAMNQIITIQDLLPGYGGESSHFKPTEWSDDGSVLMLHDRPDELIHAISDLERGFEIYYKAYAKDEFIKLVKKDDNFILTMEGDDMKWDKEKNKVGIPKILKLIKEM